MTTATREPQEGKRRHKLLTAELRKKLPKLGEQDGLGGDAIVHVKFFSPYGRYTFYITEFDGEDTLFGYCISPLGPDCDEYGYASLQEIAEAKAFGGLVPAIERDCGYPQRKLSECAGVEV